MLLFEVIEDPCLLSLKSRIIADSVKQLLIDAFYLLVFLAI
jgi:hypothetical protein